MEFLWGLNRTFSRGSLPARAAYLHVRVHTHTHTVKLTEKHDEEGEQRDVGKYSAVNQNWMHLYAHETLYPN